MTIPDPPIRETFPTPALPPEPSSIFDAEDLLARMGARIGQDAVTLTKAQAVIDRLSQENTQLRAALTEARALFEPQPAA